MLDGFAEKGWARFPVDAKLKAWADHAAPVADRLTRDPKLQSEWLRHGETWFVGANVLGNTPAGQVADGPDLAGRAVDAARAITPFDLTDWGPGQVSTCYPGYPRQDADESDANHRFRLKRDAAHLDGLKPIGPKRRRHMDEFHAFILGIPVTDNPPEAAPFVVWEGSHKLFQDMLQTALGDIPPEDWPKTDLTEIYTETRARIFETCKRVEIPLKPGEASLTHRFALHGVAPWGGDSTSERTIIYFRPYRQGDPSNWLTAP